MNNKKLKGFTLVELIIVIGLMSALMVMVGLILKPISQVFADTTSYTEDRYVMDGISQYLEESLKYADNVLIIYNKDYFSLADDVHAPNDFDYVASLMNVDYANNAGKFKDNDVVKEAYKNSIQAIGIINDFSDNIGNYSSYEKYSIDDFTDNSDIQHMGRIYKSAYIEDPSNPSNGERKVWLVGGEAFYGDGSYFINIEGSDADGNNHIDSAVGIDDDGDGTADRTIYGLEYTIYSLEPTQYKKADYATNLATVAHFQGNTRDDIKNMPSINPIIKNYAEKKIVFVNQPFSYPKRGVDSPVDGTRGANSTEGNVKGSVNISPESGYNIYIYYTLKDQ